MVSFLECKLCVISNLKLYKANLFTPQDCPMYDLKCFAANFDKDIYPK